MPRGPVPTIHKTNNEKIVSVLKIKKCYKTTNCMTSAKRLFSPMSVCLSFSRITQKDLSDFYETSSIMD